MPVRQHANRGALSHPLPEVTALQAIDVVKFGATLVLVMAGVRIAQTKMDPDGAPSRALAFLFR